MPPALTEIKEDLAQVAAGRYSSVELSLPEWCAEGPVRTTFIGPSAELEEAAAARGQPPLVLLHGFDSSSLEFRRLLPALEALGVPLYVVDLLGWGFGGTSGVKSVSPAAKRAHLQAFWQQHLGGRPIAIGGASLGGGIAMDFAAAFPEAVQRLVLIDAQGFIDEAPSLGPLGGLGIKVLQSWPLRWMANQMAYYDKARFATDDAIRIGRLHVDVEGWEQASLEFLNSGGFKLSQLPKLMTMPTLLLWGKHDEILNGEEQVTRFLKELRGDVTMQWIPDCGHVPHLEQPTMTARFTADFLGSK